MSGQASDRSCTMVDMTTTEPTNLYVAIYGVNDTDLSTEPVSSVFTSQGDLDEFVARFMVGKRVCLTAAIPLTATVEVDGHRLTGRVYNVRENGWPCVETADGAIASGPRVLA